MATQTPKKIKVALREFDLTKMDRHRISIFFGSTGSGKSTLMNQVKYMHRDIPFWHVFAGI